MYLEILVVALFVSFIFLFLGAAKRNNFFLALAGILFIITGLVLASEGLSLITGETVSLASNATIANYTTITGTYVYDYTVITDSVIQALSYLLILPGAAFVLMAGAQEFEK